jgi:hypothetical protein
MKRLPFNLSPLSRIAPTFAPAVLGALVALVPLLATPAFAQPPQPGQPAPEDDPVAETARALYEEAHNARGEQNWALCHAKATAAWAIQKHPNIAAAAGDCALYLGKSKEAAEHLAFYLEHKKPSAAPATVEYFKKRFGEAAAKIAIVRLTINVEGARILLGETVVDPNTPLYLDPGDYELHAEHDGYKPLAQPLAATAGQDVTIPLELLPADTNNGHPPNGHKNGNDISGPLIWTGVGAGIVALAGIGVAIGLTVAANDKASEIDALQATLRTQHPGGCTDTIPECKTLDDTLGDKDTLHNAALGLYIGAGSLAVVAGVLIIAGIATQPDDTGSLTTTSPIQVIPIVSQNDLGLAITVGF